MIVGGQTEARAQLSSTIIDYHEPFDQGLITLYYHSAHDSIKNGVGIQKNLSCHNELLELLNNFETKTVYPVLWHFLFLTVDCLDSLIYVVSVI